MDPENTPQEIAIDAIKEKLTSMEDMQKYFHDRGMKKFSKIMRGLINDKTAELQLLQNHLTKTQEKDAREEYIIQVETERDEALKENKRLQRIINVNVAAEQKIVEK
jgi:hypothetical protein